MVEVIIFLKSCESDPMVLKFKMSSRLHCPRCYFVALSTISISNGIGLSCEKCTLSQQVWRPGGESRFPLKIYPIGINLYDS